MVVYDLRNSKASGNVHIWMSWFIFSVEPHKLDGFHWKTNWRSLFSKIWRWSILRVTTKNSHSRASFQFYNEHIVNLSRIRFFLNNKSQEVDLFNREQLQQHSKKRVWNWMWNILKGWVKGTEPLSHFCFFSFFLFSIPLVQTGSSNFTGLIFEWPDKLKCGLDRPCEFVTPGMYDPGLGLV